VQDLVNTLDVELSSLRSAPEIVRSSLRHEIVCYRHGWSISDSTPTLNCAPIHSWAKNIGYTMPRVELEPIGKNIDERRAAGIPHYRKHQFFLIE
jgi:hypothetical protein